MSAGAPANPRSRWAPDDEGEIPVDVIERGEALIAQFCDPAPHPSILDVIEWRAPWTVVHGESIGLLRSLPDGAFHALIADPPYSSGGFTRGDRTGDPMQKYRKSGTEETAPDSFAGDTRDQRGFLAWSALWLTEAERVLTEGAPALLWSDWRQLPTTTDAFQAGGLLWRGIAVWGKNDASRPMLGRFRADSEFVTWGSKGAMPLRPDVGVLPGSWTCAPVPAARRLHLTEKPIDICVELVRIVPPGSIILDPFCGSGPVGVAAVRAGLRYVGIDRSRHYANLARARIAAEVAGSDLRAAKAGQGALFDPLPGQLTEDERARGLV